MNSAAAWTTLRFRARSAGRAGLLGALLVGFALLVQVLQVHPDRARLDGMRAELAKQRAQRQVPAVPSSPVNTPSAAWLASLPAAGDAAGTLAVVHRAAVSHGLVVERSDFRMAREASVPWARYQITVPVRAAYGPLRAWLDDILQRLPGLALDELRLRREDAGAGELEAQVRLTLFLRGER